MSPVPFWPSDDSQPNLIGKAGAFFDLKRGQIVILTPDAASNGGYKQLRYGIPNGTNATISFALQPSNGGLIKYTYLLSDAPQFRQRSQRLAILLPSHDSTMVFVPCAWSFGTDETTIPDRTATVPLGRMRMAYWSDPAPGENAVSGLVTGLESSYLPGFANAFVEGRVTNPLTAEVLAALPVDIAAKAGRFLQPGIGSSPHTVLAPLFRPDADKLVIAANYHFGLQALADANRLGPDSAYFSGMLKALTGFLQNGGTGAFMLPAIAANGPLENTIQQAAALAFK